MLLFDQIASNKGEPGFSLLLFFILLAIIGAAVGYLWLGSSLGGVILALIIGGIYAFSMIFQSTGSCHADEWGKRGDRRAAPSTLPCYSRYGYMVAQIPCLESIL